MGGTAQEFTVVPAERAFALPADADVELGASIGIPAVTAHRARRRLPRTAQRAKGPDALGGRTVLVAGGAGAVGNAAIQLARWAGAEVIATVMGRRRLGSRRRPRPSRRVSYKEADAAEAIRVSPPTASTSWSRSRRARTRSSICRARSPGTISIYANDGGARFNLDVRRNMGPNARYQFVLLYTVGWDRIAAAAGDINQAIEGGALGVGEQAGLLLHRYRLDAAAAHAAVERGASARC